MSIPSPAVLALSGRGYADLRNDGVLGSSSSKDMQIWAVVQNEKTSASLTGCVLGLLCDWHRERRR
jgi:hypothetical protein